jgi:serine protease inhibitor
MNIVSAIFCITAAMMSTLWLTPTQAADPPQQEIPVPQNVVKANNSFAVDLYSRLASQPGNLFFSPYSIENVLAMSWAGARGETASQMARVMHLSISQDAAAAEFAALTKTLALAGQPVTGISDSVQARSAIPFQLSIATSLWCREGHPFLDRFLTTAKEDYGASIYHVDFSNAHNLAYHSIDDWIAKQTRGKIEHAIPSDTIDARTRLVLANTIYLKARWEHEFKKEFTHVAPFQPIRGSKISVPMMNTEDSFFYSETDEAQVLEMPYLFDKASMVVILPKKVDGLPSVEGALTNSKLEQLLARGQLITVKVSFPRFKSNSAFDIIPALREIGMTKAFSLPEADFTGIDGTNDLFISSVLHQAFVDVDEEGTEAIAATEVTFAKGLIDIQDQTVTFVADHPFLFIIRHSQTGAILFMGRLETP